MKLHIDVGQEIDGRFLAEIMELPGVMSYGESPEDALLRTQALALRVVADRMDNGEVGAFVSAIEFEKT